MALGTTAINCKVTQADKTTVTVSCFVTVRTRVPSAGVTINNANYQISNAHVMKAGDVFDFNADIMPAQSTDKVFWEIADNSYALVTADGVVAALKPGITRLIAYAGRDESSARSEANRVVDEIYIYITASTGNRLFLFRHRQNLRILWAEHQRRYRLHRRCFHRSRLQAMQK